MGIELAKAGRDDEVISLLESINPEEVVFGMVNYTNHHFLFFHYFRKYN